MNKKTILLASTALCILSVGVFVFSRNDSNPNQQINSEERCLNNNIIEPVCDSTDHSELNDGAVRPKESSPSPDPGVQIEGSIITSGASLSATTVKAENKILPKGRYRQIVFNNIKETKDITFKNTFETVINGSEGNYNMEFDTNSPRELKLNIYEPTKDTYQNNRPLIIFVHGGGWVYGDRYQREPEAIYYAKLGYTTASIEYSLLPDNGPPADAPGNNAYAQIITENSDDISTAYKYLISHASRYHIDETKIGMGGWSVGGMNINVLTHLNTPYKPVGLRGVLVTSTLFPSGISGLFNGFRTFDTKYKPVTKFVSNTTDPDGSITFIEDCGYLDSIGHTCTHELLDGTGHDLSFHLPPLKETAEDFFAKNIAGVN